MKTTYPWHLAPLWAKYAATDENGAAYFSDKNPFPIMLCWDHDNMTFEIIPSFKGNGANWQNNLQEIPERERELNRLAEFKSIGEYLRSSFTAQGTINWDELQERRRQRIEAGLIDGDNGKPKYPRCPNGVEDKSVIVTYSDGTKRQTLGYAIEDWDRVTEYKLTKSSDQSEWTPEVGERCEMTLNSVKEHYRTGVVEFYGDDFFVWREENEKQPVYGLHTASFRPIPTESPEQKAERQFEEFKNDLVSFIDARRLLSSHKLAGSILNYLDRDYRLVRKEKTDDE